MNSSKGSNRCVYYTQTTKTPIILDFNVLSHRDSISRLISSHLSENSLKKSAFYLSIKNLYFPRDSLKNEFNQIRENQENIHILEISSINNMNKWHINRMNTRLLKSPSSSLVNYLKYVSFGI